MVAGVKERPTLTANQELMRRLRRSAVEPSRVYCGSDWNDDRLPVAVCTTAFTAEAWYGPASVAWLFRGDVDPTLQRAIGKFGTVDVDRSPALGRLLAMGGSRLELGEPAVHEYPANSLFPRNYAVPVFYVFGNTSSFVPATPAVHALRRYGEEGEWVLIDGQPVVRYETEEGPVALIKVFQPRARSA